MIRFIVFSMFVCLSCYSKLALKSDPQYKVYYANGDEIPSERYRGNDKDWIYKVVLNRGEELQGYRRSSFYEITTILSDEFQLKIKYDLIEKLVLISSPIYLKNGKVLKVDIIEEKEDFILIKENNKTKKIAKKDIKFYNKGGKKYIKTIKSPIVQGIKCSLIPKIKDCYNYDSIELYPTKENEKLTNLELLPKVKRVILFSYKGKSFDLTSLNKYKNITHLQININDNKDYIQQIKDLVYIKSLSLHQMPGYFHSYIHDPIRFYSGRINILIYNKMENLSFELPKLSNKNIEELDLSFSKLTGKLNLQELPKVKKIFLIRSKIKDLSFLKKNIEEIDISEAEITNMKALNKAEFKVLYSKNPFKRENNIERLKETYPNVNFEEGTFGWSGIKY